MACLSIMLKKKEKIIRRVGARTQPCFTPFVMGNGSDRLDLTILIFMQQNDHVKESL